MTTGDAHTDVLVIGSGIAGCATALAAARAGADVTIATKAARPEDTATWWAQGGIAISRDDPEGFKRDVIAASSDTADPAAVDVLVTNANDAVQEVLIETLAVPFDTDGETFDFGREAAHAESRILHVNAATGEQIQDRFLAHVAGLDGVTVREDTAALDLITHDGTVRGAYLESDGEVWPVFAGATVLATGGIGTLYPETTNPEGATGDGIGMAALAGAAVRDLEFVQFHPTVYTDGETLLITEAVRGEGAVLRNGDSERFMPAYHADADLAPRDVVARAVATERERTGEVRLDVSPLAFDERFPDLARTCDQRGIDWVDGIPVAPAEHFCCGGVAVDDRGRTSLDRLFAVGECACSGVHGANRLASTSLLEGLVWGLRAGETAAGSEPNLIDVPALDDRDPTLPASLVAQKRARLQRVMGRFLGIERDPDRLPVAVSSIRRLKGTVDAYVRTRTDRSVYELRNATVTALLIARAAAANDESVGTHTLVTDAPTAEPRG